jgi:hypothetical protein
MLPAILIDRKGFKKIFEVSAPPPLELVVPEPVRWSFSHAPNERIEPIVASEIRFYRDGWDGREIPIIYRERY